MAEQTKITFNDVIWAIDRALRFSHEKLQTDEYTSVRRERAIQETKDILDLYVEQRIFQLLEERFGLLPSPLKESTE